jgi:hypothetical protein
MRVSEIFSVLGRVVGLDVREVEGEEGEWEEPGAEVLGSGDGDDGSCMSM